MTSGFSYLGSLYFGVEAISLIFIDYFDLFVFLCNLCHYSVPVLYLAIVLLSLHLSKWEIIEAVKLVLKTVQVQPTKYFLFTVLSEIYWLYGIY